MLPLDGHEMFISKNFCKDCKRHIFDCICHLIGPPDKTLAEIIDEKKKGTFKYATRDYESKSTDYNNMENYND